MSKDLNSCDEDCNYCTDYNCVYKCDNTHCLLCTNPNCEHVGKISICEDQEAKPGCKFECNTCKSHVFERSENIPVKWFSYKVNIPETK